MNESRFNFEPVQTTPFTFKVKIKNLLWQLINRTIFRLLPSAFKSYRIFLLRLFGASLANDVNISRLALIDHPWNLKMGSLSSLGEGSWTYCLALITIGEKCCIGKNVFLITGSHDVNDANFTLQVKPIIINEGCWVATGAYILPGVTLAKFTVIAAKSLVIKDTEEFSIVGGNPAKFIKTRIFNKNY